MTEELKKLKNINSLYKFLKQLYLNLFQYLLQGSLKRAKTSYYPLSNENKLKLTSFFPLMCLHRAGSYL